MKKILILNRSSIVGGIEKSLISFLKYLVDKEYEIDLLIWNKPDLLFDKIPKGVNIIQSPKLQQKESLKSKNLFNRLFAYIKYVFYKLNVLKGIGWKSFPKLKKEYDIGISYCQDGYSPYYLIDNVNCKKKILFFHHGKYEQINPRDSYYYEKYDSIVAVSDFVKEMLGQSFPDLKQKMSVIYNMTDFDEIKSESHQQADEMNYHGLKLLTVARITKEKGYENLVKAAKVLEDKGLDFKWYVVGCGGYEDEIYNMVNDFSVKSIVFLGEKKNPYPYMNKCDIYVQPSIYEAFGLTVQEALFLEKPVIATNIPTFNEMLINNGVGKVGITVNYNELSTGILKYIESKELREEIENNNKKLVFDNSESERRIDNLLKL